MSPRLRDVLVPGYFLRERDVIVPSEWRYQRAEQQGLMRTLNDWDERTVPLADRLYRVGLEGLTMVLGAGGAACAAGGAFGGEIGHRISGTAAAIAAYTSIRMVEALRIHYNRRSIWQNVGFLRKRAALLFAQPQEHNHIENKYYFGLQQVGHSSYTMTHDAACDRCTAEVIDDEQPPLYVLEKPTEIYGRYCWRRVPETVNADLADGFDDSA